MANVSFTPHLARFFPELAGSATIDGQTVAEIVAALDARHPGLAAYLVDERGALRKHVNIFVDKNAVSDRTELSDAVGPSTDVFIAQALSGG